MPIKANAQARGEVNSRDRRKRLHEQLAGHHLETAVGGAPYPDAERPKRPGMAIFRPLLVEPSPVEAEEVMETPGGAIERMAQKRGVRGGQRAHALRLFAEIFEQHGENEGAGIVVGAVAFGEVGDAENGVLENAR